MKCDRKGCNHDAKWQMGWRAWALGQSQQLGYVTAYMALGVCDKHKKTTSMGDIVTRDGAAEINNRLTAMHKVPLDFSKAEVLFHEIIDGKYYLPPGVPDV